MDKRFLLALLLTAVVVFVTPLLFPTGRRAPAGAADGPDSARARTTRASATTEAPAAAGVPSTPASAPAESLPAAPPPPTVAAAAETVSVTTPLATYRFSTLGAHPVAVTLHKHRALTPEGGGVDLVRAGVPLLRYRLVTGGDTLALDRLPFTVSRTHPHAGTRPISGTRPVGSGAASSADAAAPVGPLTFHTTADGREVAITYTFAPDSYLVRVSGHLRGTSAPGSSLLITLPNGLPSEEADTLDDQRHLAYVLKPTNDGARSVGFDNLDPGERRVQNGPLTWLASKNKYFLVALLTPETPGARPFDAALITGGPRVSSMATNADATMMRRLGPDGAFAFELYTGPQEWRRLIALGRELENANPYGGFMQGVVQPFATIVMRILLWMHETLKLSYGWVLVIFGVVVRLILWPLNQGAMRNSLKMQRIQPELAEVQKKYKTNPEKQQAEMMRIYREHGMSPFSMFSGCLPMLHPMPVMFALFFVFQITIEFRGVSFLWLPDISLKDPYYIVPVLMGLSMFALSWIGMRGAPPNPQAKMMAYVFPPMMTVFFLNLASGLNLYYAVQNIAALPQQWLIARERAKVSPPPKASPPKAAPAKVAAAPRK